MSHLDKIIDFLSYHPGLSRPDIMAQLNLGVGETQVKMALADGLARGDLRVEGKARATRYFVTAKGRLLKTVNLDTYYPKFVSWAPGRRGFCRVTTTSRPASVQKPVFA